MTEVFIKYNPYRLITEITIDGEIPKKNSKLNFGDRRLQEWVENLPEILLEECNTKQFKIVFHGTTPDYEDIEAMTYDAKKNGLLFELEHIKAKEVADKEKQIQDIFNEIQKGPFDELRQPDVIKAFNNAKNSEFEVNVVATMSAGKSTLINSLLRKKLMPAKQDACTAIITEIKDNDDFDIFDAKVYDRDGNLLQTQYDIDYDTMKQLNDDPLVSKIKIEGNIPFVASDDISLVLVDTPGPNNSRDPEHRATTYRMLSESTKTVVLYVMNATQLATDDDFNLLKHVSDSMKVGGKQSRDRFIFVVNKLDDFKKGEDSVVSAIEKVRKYLNDNGIENPNIYPASALTALDIRTTLSKDNLDEEDDEVYEARGKVRKFNRNDEMHFEKYSPLTPSMRGEITNQLASALQKDDKNTQALIHCGIVPIESAIQMYVNKYAKTAKIKNIVDTFISKLESANSFEKTKQDIITDKEKQKILMKQISLIKKKMNDGKTASKFKEKINSINYEKDITLHANRIISEAQHEIQKKINSMNNQKISTNEARMYCEGFERFIANIDANVNVNLSDIINKQLINNVQSLLQQYKNKIASLTEDLDVGNVNIDTFELMKGEINIDSHSLINNITQSERVVVDEVWVKNTNKKWYNPFTWFQESGHYKKIYEDKEFVDGKQLAEYYFAPFEESLHKNKVSAIDYSKKQTENIKSQFIQKFDDLDNVLRLKLEELEKFANDEKDVSRRIKETQDKLTWLENISYQVKTILDI